jgi:hypothetical protein
MTVTNGPENTTTMWTDVARALLRLHYAGPISRLLGRLIRGITERYLAMEAAGLDQRSEQLAAAPKV